MKIIYLGEELDSSIEHELITESEFGFNIKIKYTEESWYRDKNEETFNRTEFHWRYDEYHGGKLGERCAFESDIHQTGFTRECSCIEEIEIVMSDKLYEKY